MRIVSIEPTPSPHSMKLTVDELLAPGERYTYRAERPEEAPEALRPLLRIPGVAGLYRTADFIALDRKPQADWSAILAAAREALGVVAAGGAGAGTSASGDGDGPGASNGGNAGGAGAGEGGAGRQASGAGATGGTAGGVGAAVPAAGFGEVNVLVQTFRRIPMQVRVRSELEERRSALPERFVQAATEAGLAAPNLIMERRLEERGVRYGELDAVLAEVVRELDAAYDDARLAALVEAAVRMDQAEAAQVAAGASETGAGGASAAAERRESPGFAELAEALASDEWRVRYAALDRLRPTPEALPLLAQALGDPQMSVRRLAVVYLGELRLPEALPHLLRALEDSAVAVRRTAGDTLSDIGDPAAMPAMAKALRDSSKLVRWRAARFLFEQGDETVLDALREAANDPEFEVALQIRMAIERIERGESASGSVWQQMTGRNRE